MNIKVLLYLCINNEFDLLEEVLLENKNSLNSSITLDKDFIKNLIEDEYIKDNYLSTYKFNSIIDCLLWLCIINKYKNSIKFLLNLDFFDYKFMENSFFIAACEEDIELLTTLINNGFDYKVSMFKYGKDEIKRDCSCLDSILIGSLCRNNQNTINFIINLPNITIYDFELSIISIIIYERKDILQKLIKSNDEALNYIKFLDNLNSYKYIKEINYIKDIYNL